MSSGEVDDLLAELDGMMDSPKNKSSAETRGGAKSSSQKSSSDVEDLLDIVKDVGEPKRQSSETRIRCTDCDFRVIVFQDRQWKSSADYMFLRNNFPDENKLQKELVSSRGSKAHCCQCKAENNVNQNNLPLGWYQRK